jgi:hypothetical protein
VELRIQKVTQPLKLITKPSLEAVASHKKALNRILVNYRGAPLESIIERLATRIKGWTWYHSITQSTRTFSKMDEWFIKMFKHQIQSWLTAGILDPMDKDSSDINNLGTPQGGGCFITSAKCCI